MTIIGVVVRALFSRLILWVIGKIKWGLDVDGFGLAYLAAIIVAVLSAFFNLPLTQLGNVFVSD